MKRNKADYYTYRVFWSDEDGEFTGLCTEFPGLSWLHEDREKAFRGIRDLVADTVKDMEENGEKIPEPLSVKEFSGKISLRIPPELHRMLVMNAAESGISLNRYINSKLGKW